MHVSGILIFSYEDSVEKELRIPSPKARTLLSSYVFVLDGEARRSFTGATGDVAIILCAFYLCPIQKSKSIQSKILSNQKSIAVGTY
jgi:hypothetical protein